VKYVIYGAGAIGGLVGALLAEAGEDVVLIARGAHREVMERDGLLLETPEGSRRIRVPVAADPAGAGIGSRDVVMLAMKSQHTGAALDELARTLGRHTPIVCLQNGVDNERAAQRLFSHVYAVCVMCPATHLEPGVIVASSSPVPGLLDIGRYPAGIDANTRTFAAALTDATFESVERPDIMRWKYRKLLANIANAVEVVCRPPGRAQVRDLARSEAEACLRAAGIDYASEEEDTARRGDLIEVKPVGGKRRQGGSTWQSIERGAGSVETDYLNGEIVLLGRLHAIPTPVNAALQESAARVALGRAEPGYMSVEEFLDDV